ncbi:MAG: GNAT family N-acetyltransferase [Candidatus Magasanikbacteria bacterium]|nr:GNAT family N-acetyltransferase [Candidatus Magasanikbacteria bacterium]
MKGPILSGKRIKLQPIKLSDAPDFIRWFSDKEVAVYLLRQTPMTLSEEKKWIKKILRAKDKIIWSIFNEKGRLIGNTGLTIDAKNKAASFGIMIGEKGEWGKGYAGECLKIIGNFVFIKLKYNRLELEVYMKNKRALRVYEKAGFLLEGVKRQKLKNAITKKFEDAGIMSILSKEWKF